jgi:hypothetical protein
MHVARGALIKSHLEITLLIVIFPILHQYSLRRELPCIVCLVKVKLFKF